MYLHGLSTSTLWSHQLQSDYHNMHKTTGDSIQTMLSRICPGAPWISMLCLQWVTLSLLICLTSGAMRVSTSHGNTVPLHRPARPGQTGGLSSARACRVSHHLWMVLPRTICSLGFYKLLIAWCCSLTAGSRRAITSRDYWAMLTTAPWCRAAVNMGEGGMGGIAVDK